jgi:rhodanese-related sulfurtransferase
MTKILLEKISSLFKRDSLPVITEQSLIHEIADLYPNFYDFIQRKYGLKILAEERNESLKTLVARHQLPPPQVVFMEVQMSNRSEGVKELPASEASKLIEEGTRFSILDVRENWELNMGSLPKSIPLTADLLDEILQNWEREKPLLLYCHFGIRSLDAASFLADRGFTNVCVLKGGIDSWASEVDPTLPRYEGAYC